MKKILLLIVLVTVLAGCTKSAQDTHKLKIVTTIAPLYSFATNIAPGAKIINIVPPGISEHVWEPKPADIANIASADVIIKNGLNLEMFLSDMIDASGNKNLKVIDSSAGIETEVSQDEDIKGQDPHIWLSVSRAIQQVENISNGLAKIDPNNAEKYTQNAQNYISELISLNTQISASFAKTIPKNFIVFHNAYQYFLNDFNLTKYQKGAIEEFPGREPSQQELKKMIDQVKLADTKIIFTEPQFAPKVVQTLVDELNVKSYEIDPVGNELSKQGYANNMRKLAQTFINAFTTK